MGDTIKIGETVLPENHPLTKAVQDTLGLHVQRDEGTEVQEDTQYVDPEEFLAQDPTSLEDVIAEAEKAAEMTYEQRVLTAGVTLKEARDVINDIFVKGEYQKTYPITGDITVTFRTRDGDANTYLLEELERKNYGYNATIADHHTRYNMAASLVSLGSPKKMSKMDPEDIEKTLRFLGKLPAPLLTILINKLVKFEEMLAIVLDEGAIQNF